MNFDESMESQNRLDDGKMARVDVPGYGVGELDLLALKDAGDGPIDDRRLSSLRDSMKNESQSSVFRWNDSEGRPVIVGKNGLCWIWSQYTDQTRDPDTVTRLLDLYDPLAHGDAQENALCAQAIPLVIEYSRNNRGLKNAREMADCAKRGYLGARVWVVFGYTFKPDRFSDFDEATIVRWIKELIHTDQVSALPYSLYENILSMKEIDGKTPREFLREQGIASNAEATERFSMKSPDDESDKREGPPDLEFKDRRINSLFLSQYHLLECRDALASCIEQAIRKEKSSDWHRFLMCESMEGFCGAVRGGRVKVSLSVSGPLGFTDEIIAEPMDSNELSRLVASINKIISYDWRDRPVRVPLEYAVAVSNQP